MGKRSISFYFGFLFVAALIATVGAFSQTPYLTRINFSLPIQEPVFYKVVQDQRGYLWLGSDAGLYRFNGKEFTMRYPLNDTLDPRITALFEDQEGRMWFGCQDGSIRFFEGDRLVLFNPEEGTSSSRISDILVDTAGIIWWSTFGEGIYYFSNDRVYNINRLDDGLSDDFVYELAEETRGRIYAATDNGLSCVWLDNGEKRVDIPVDPGILPDIIVKSLKKGPDGRLWLGFQDEGIGILDPSTMEMIRPPISNGWGWGPVDLMAFSGETVWTGTFGGRLIQLDPDHPDQTLFWETDNRGNSFGRIHNLANDTEGNIWIMASGGLFRSSGTRIQFMNTTEHPTIHDVHSIMHDSRHNLWYCNDEGVFRYDLQDRKARNFLQDFRKKGVHFMCLEEDRYGYIWAGTFDYGLFRLDPSTGNYWQITEKDGLVNNNVLSISRHHDTLWMATLGGASSIVLKGNGLHSPLDITSFNQENGLVNTFIYDVYEDALNRIWFATDGDGICVYAFGKFTYFSEREGLGDDVIYSITGDKEGNIWFSTSSDGVYRYDGRNFQHFGPEEGLRSLEISSLSVTGSEVIVVHGLGLDIIHLPEMTVRSFGKESGLVEMAPELNAIHSDRQGTVWIGAKTGIIRYREDDADVLFTPATIIEKMSVFLEPVEMKNGQSLKANQDHISFMYSGIWLSDPEMVIYSTFLEGYDLDWKETYDQVATYSSLRPGTYTFHVRSALDSTFNHFSESSFSFTIKRPVWASPWFILLIAALVATIIYSIMKFRERKLKAIERQKKEKVEFEFQLLKNQVNPHFLFNSFSTLISLIEENGKVAMEYTERLSDFFRRVLQVKESEVVPLSEELDLIKDYLFIQQKRYGELIKLENRLEGKVLQSFIPPMTLQILMENAIKHNIISREKNLHIRILQEGDWLVVENSFQPKRTTEESTGIGLQNISRRYRLLIQKEIIIEQTENLFRVKLPVI